MNRYKAALIHLGLSVSALLLLTLVTLAYWYPQPHFDYEGTFDVLVLIVMVDVVIGPIITLIVYAPDKPSLKFDLWTIAIIQVAAFAYGSFVISSQRPVFMVYAKGQFSVVSAALIDADKIPDQSLREGFHPGPRLVMARLPDDPKVHAEYALLQLTQGKRMSSWPEFYQPYAPKPDEIEREALDIEQLMKSESRRKAIVDFFNQHGLEKNDVYLLALRSSVKRTVIVLNRESLQPIGYLDIPV